MSIYDAHIHFYFPSSVERLQQAFQHLQEIGLSGFSALVLPEYPPDINVVRKMIPVRFHGRMTLEVLSRQQDPFPYFAWAEPLKVSPFVDSRFITEGIAEKMARFRWQGYRGLKVFYLPEDDPAMQVQGMQAAYGWPVRKSEEITADLIDGAASQSMCVLFHADLRRYGDFVEDMIRSHPGTQFNIPHFGFSRKSMAPLLEAYPNCYTDTSALAPFMEAESEPYRDFLRAYQDKIIFGSDALVVEPQDVESALRSTRRLIDDEEIFHKLVHRNYLLLHGIHDP